MPSIVKPVLPAILACLLAGCTSLATPEYSYNEIVIVNQTRTPVRDVSILATGSGRVFSCGSIAPRGICSNSFPPLPYGASPVQITWMLGSGVRHDKTVELSIPANFDPRIPMRGVLLINPRGEVSAYLQQDAPGPHR